MIDKFLFNIVVFACWLKGLRPARDHALALLEKGIREYEEKRK